MHLTPYIAGMKHVEIDLHNIHNKVAIEEVHVLYVPMTSQLADIFTKVYISTLLRVSF
jgi:hypothetical protein